jgi:transcriptional regulator with XRE-family HTH domain
MAALREVRAKHLVSIRDLAKEARVAPSTIYLIERGRSTPRPAIMRRLAAALGVDPSEINEFRRAIEASMIRGHRRDRAEPTEN